VSALSVLEHPDVRTLGITLLHFVWQGAIVALALALANAGLRGRSARPRYAVASAALLAMLALPVATFVVSRSAPPRVAAESAVRGAPVTTPVPAGGVAPERWARVEQRVAEGLPWVVATWSLGVLALSIRFLGGWLLVRRLARAASPLPDWQATLERLAQRLRVWQPVRVCESMLVEVPTVVGWLRPLILLPAATLAGFTPMQLEALLAHELAHIRRLDYLSNLVQRLAETLLFYHPAVWWASHRMRVEREHCCDDAAVALCGDPLAYARTLATLAGLRAPATVVAASGGSLFTRVKRLVAAPDPHEPQTPRWTAALLTLTVLATLGLLPLLDHGGRAASAAQRPAGADQPSPALGSEDAIDETRTTSQAGSEAAAASPEARDLTLEAIMELAENGVTPEYLDQMEALGYRALPWQSLIELRSNGVTPAVVEELRSIGYTDLSPEQLVEMANQGVTPEFVRELAEVGFKDVGVDELTHVREQGVTPDFIREMKALGVSARSLNDFADLVNQGVTPDFVSELKRNGYDDLSSSWLIELRSQGVSPEQVARLRELGHDKLSPSRLVALASEGVTPEFIDEMKKLGYPELSLPMLIGLRSHGVDPEFVRELQSAGYEKLPLGVLIELRDHGVDAAFANEMKEAGFERLSPEQLIELRDRGVDGDMLRRFKGARR
jgi:beta-lactamase regulating signal transducer with metallopeptidase domain